MGGFKKNTKATRVYKKFTHSWSQDIYESNRSSWTKEDDIDLLYINRLLNLKSRTKKIVPHIKLNSGDFSDWFMEQCFQELQDYVKEKKGVLK